LFIAIMAVLQEDVTQNDIAAFTKVVPALKNQIQEGIAVVRKIRAKFSEDDVNTASVSKMLFWIRMKQESSI
jgi:hypothetical protein